jgi:alkylhydroperoxidase family enzyme
VFGAADIENLRTAGYPDEQILEAAAVIAAFNMIGRIAAALGVETEHFQEMIADMKQGHGE